MGDHSDAPPLLHTHKVAAMVNFGSGECFESQHSLALFDDHILEAPEEFRGAKDLDNRSERVVRGRARNRDELNVQDVTCGCTAGGGDAQEALVAVRRNASAQRENGAIADGDDAHDAMMGTRLETIDLISDCCPRSSGDDDDARDVIDKMKIRAMNDRNRSTPFINKSADDGGGGHIDERRVGGGGVGAACEVDSSGVHACDGVRETEARPPSIVHGGGGGGGVMCAPTAPGCSRVADAPANACTATAAAAVAPAAHRRDDDDVCAHPNNDASESERRPRRACSSATTTAACDVDAAANSIPSIFRDINSIAARVDYVPSDLSLELIHTKNELNKLKEHVQSWTTNGLLLSSKELNRRTLDGRLQHLGAKLKAAGIEIEDSPQVSETPQEDFHQWQKEKDRTNNLRNLTDCIDLQPDEKQVVDDDGGYDDNQNLVLYLGSDEITTEFDVSKYDLSNYGCLSNDYFVVYDEFEENEDALVDGKDVERESHCCVRTKSMKSMMGTTDGDRKQHNPDKDNLRSLLKKPGPHRGRDKKNRVIFKEDKNEFFDADYIILIREDCDYDEEDDDGVCTCNQHEMVRLTCCEPNCNCNMYEFDPTPQSPKFAPPLEFVDAVTLSPPDGYKDMELGEQQLLALQQMAARRGQQLAPMAPVCRECSQTHCDDGEYTDDEPQSDQETEKTDQSQQTTPTTPPEEESPDGQKLSRSKAAPAPHADQRCEVEMNDDHHDGDAASVPPGGSPISGILKGGRLWKQQSAEVAAVRPQQPPAEPKEPPQQPDVAITSDDESGGKRSVRFIESEGGAVDQIDSASPPAEGKAASDDQKHHQHPSASPDATEMTLTFKLGNHILISNNSLKPNSAVRQLFPCTKPQADKAPAAAGDEGAQYLVTAESLKAFDEAKKLKLPQCEADESIKRVIERNTLRRSLIRYEPRAKKHVHKTDNSLVERIKQLTCDVDEPLPEEEQARASPAGEEAKNSPELPQHTLKSNDKSFSPASSSSSNSSGSTTYKRLTDLFAKKERPDIQDVDGGMAARPQAPDLGGPQEFIDPHSIAKLHAAAAAAATAAASNDNRKQFLATLGPLSACVGGAVHAEDYYYQTATGDRLSMASSIGTEYSLEDIEEGLKKDEESKRTPPDVLAGTPSASESGDELAMFVQQDATRIERIKKKYQQDDEEDEHDDYGFNRRPSVRGIKPRFGTTTEIMQQIQQQIQPPPTTASTLPRNAPLAWPYYSETNLSGVDNKRNINAPNYQYAHQYRPTTLVDENAYQNCANQQPLQPPLPAGHHQQQAAARCPQVTYRSNMNVYTSSPIMRIGGGCTDYYQSLPRNRNGRPQSPPPQEVTKGIHQMMYIPYNHIEGIQGTYYDATYACVSNQNQINKRYINSTYADVYSTAVSAAAGKSRGAYTITSRSESPAYSTARSTQTPQTCTYYPPRYRPPNGIAWIDGLYKPGGGNRYGRMHLTNAVDNISLTDSDSQHSQHSQHLPNGYKDSMPNSPTKPKFIERGVPEGAASVSSQDGQGLTSPTSPQTQPTSKPLFYAMNV